MDHASLTTLESMNQAMWYNRWTLGKFARYMRGDILEVGCGIGNFTPSLTPYGRVWAFDADRHAVAETKKRAKGSASVGQGNIETGNYFFGNKKFSSLVCLNVLEHVKDDRQALANMRRLLVPDGYLILLVPIHPALFGTIDQAIGHHRRYVPKVLMRQVKHQSFRIISARKLNLFGAIGWWVAGTILKRTAVNETFIRFFNLVSPLFLTLENMFEPPIGTSLLLIARKARRNESAAS